MERVLPYSLYSFTSLHLTICASQTGEKPSCLSKPLKLPEDIFAMYNLSPAHFFPSSCTFSQNSSKGMPFSSFPLSINSFRASAYLALKPVNIHAADRMSAIDSLNTLDFIDGTFPPC